MFGNDVAAAWLRVGDAAWTAGAAGQVRVGTNDDCGKAGAMGRPQMRDRQCMNVGYGRTVMSTLVHLRTIFTIIYISTDQESSRHREAAVVKMLSDFSIAKLPIR